MEDVILAVNLIKILVTLYTALMVFVVVLITKKKTSGTVSVKVLGFTGLLMLLVFLIILRTQLLPSLGIFAFSSGVIFYVYKVIKENEEK